jgi:phage shock protein A
MAKEKKELTDMTVEEVKKEIEAIKEEPKKVRKPREKVRPVEETLGLSVSKLTDKEKEALIKHLKEENTLLSNKVDSYKQNAGAAFDQTRQLEDQYKAMEQFYRGRLQYVDNQLNAFHAAINEAIKGGIA